MWKIIITSVIIAIVDFDRVLQVECSIPCDFLYGGCKPQRMELTIPPILTATSLKYPDHIRYSTSTHNNNYQTFVPSPPGKLPRCAKPGLTFCEKIDRYPGDLIKTLAVKANYNFRTLFLDEFSNRKDYHHGYDGTKYSQSVHFQTPSANVHFDVGVNNLNQSSQHGNYPDRRYSLDESATHIVDPILYASLSDLSSSNDPNKWWKRSEKSNDKTGHQRKRRQTAATELCPTRSQFIMPRAALNNRGEWKFVVNVEQGPERFTQLVRSETCLTTECNGICSLPNGYRSRCEQKFVQKRLVALDGTGNNLYTDIFWFPHCCVCQIAPDIR